MKFLALASLVALAHSFPTAENFLKLARRSAQPHAAVPDTYHDFHATLLKLREKRLLFDPLTAPIDVTGAHAFQPPKKGEQRGPCPGLNSLANHGYISRDGIVSIPELISAGNTVLGMGIDIMTILAVMGTVGVGNPLSLDPGFSIGGETPKVSNLLGNVLGLLGTPRGLHGSHNWIEADSSATRDDLYVTGNAWTMNISRFTSAHNSVEGDVIAMDDLWNLAAKRFDESIQTNPFFYYGPYSGMIARNAGYAFLGRLLSNHSREFPGGQLTKKVFKSFFAVHEEGGRLVYKEGWERIPDNWYRTPVDYDLLHFNLDLLDLLGKHPVLASVGGNLGRVNSFAGVDVGDVTGGALNAATLLEDNHLLCFTLEVVKTFAPNSLSTLFKALEVPLRLVNDAVLSPLLDLSCPEFKDLKMGGSDLLTGLRGKFPGASKGTFAL